MLMCLIMFALVEIPRDVLVKGDMRICWKCNGKGKV